MADLHEIPLIRLLYILIPMLVVVGIHLRWGTGYLRSLYAIGRMLLQLVAIGFMLTFIFELERSWLIFIVLLVMSVAATIISLRNIRVSNIWAYLKTYLIIISAGGVVIYISTQLVLDLEPWYYPRFFIPLSGMVFANTMNSVSITSERFNSEYKESGNYTQARNKAFKAGLIPVTNSFLAVGLVSIPGMMTGQILSGVSPLIAARYQVLIMCMVYTSAGVASAMYLRIVKN